MVGNVENSCFQKSSRSSTAANWSWICSPRRRGTESVHLFFLNLLSLYLANPCSPLLQQQDSPEPVTSNGEPFHFLPTAPDDLFCKGSPSMKKVIMAVHPDLLQSASQRRQTSASAAPRVPTKKRKIFTRRVIKKTAPPSPSPSDSNTNQVIHLSEFSWMFFLYIYICSGWL